MSSIKKLKIFPKIKKKLKGFVTEESGKISKKDALGLAAGAVLLSGVEETMAGHASTYCGHANYGHANGVSSAGPVSVYKAKPVSHISTSSASFTPTNNNSGHVSGNLASGHVNSSVNTSPHTSHASHGSHGSHGSRW